MWNTPTNTSKSFSTISFSGASETNAVGIFPWNSFQGNFFITLTEFLGWSVETGDEVIRFSPGTKRVSLQGTLSP
jgi:hypothetical protein